MSHKNGDEMLAQLNLLIGTLKGNKSLKMQGSSQNS